MRRDLRFWPVVLLGCLLLPGSTPRAQEDGGSGDARAVVDRLAQAQGDGFWREVHRLEEMGTAGMAAARTGARDHENLRVRLGCARVLFAGDAREEAVAVLLRILHDGDAPMQRDAAELLAGLIDGKSGYGDPDEIASGLEEQLDEASDPLLRVALAQTLFRLSGSGRAVRELKDLMGSSDTEAVDAAAIALAELDNFDADVVGVLDGLAGDPTAQGRLAASLLRTRRLEDRLERELIPKSKSRYDFRPLEELFRLIERRYVDPDGITVDKLMEAALRGAGDALDPFSNYLTEADRKKLLESIRMKYGGIGAYVHIDAETKYLVIDRPVYGGPADKAGLCSNDRVVEVEGETTRGKSLDDLVGLLKGEPGTEVTIKVIRRGWAKERPFTLTRANVAIRTAKSDVLPGAIGYVRLSSFGDTTAQELREEVEALQAAGMKAMILDMRGNPGGYLSTAVSVLDLFLPAGKVVVTTRGRNGALLERLETQDDDEISLPCFVLINEGSASAAEIVSGALQDYGRAVIMGETSFGKGSVQNLIDLVSTNGETAMRLTVAKYFLPSGRSIHRKDRKSDDGGVEPDIKVEPAERDYWKDAEMAKLLDSGKLEAYLDGAFESHRDRFLALAVDDKQDASLYPGFGEVFPELDTKLDEDGVRLVLRDLVRRRAADARGHEFLTDVQTDRQLQRSILEALEVTKQDAAGIPQYSGFAHHFDEESTEEGQPR